MEQLVKFKSMSEIAQFAKNSTQMLFFDEEMKQRKFISSLVLDLYEDSKKLPAENYANRSIDYMDVVMLHYRAADKGLDYMKGDFSIVKFGGKNPRPQVFTSYHREREDVLNSPIVAEFYPQTIYNGSKVVQLDTLQWNIEPQKKSARKLNAQGQFDLTNVMGFAFTLITTSGRKFTYFTTKEEIFFEIGKDEKTLFMYRGANGETMFWKFVMRKLLKWLPISLVGVKNWEEAEIVAEIEEKAPIQSALGSGENFAKMSAFNFGSEKLEAAPQIEVAKKTEQKIEVEAKPTLTLGSVEFQKITEEISSGEIAGIAQVEEQWELKNDVREILNEML